MKRSCDSSDSNKLDRKTVERHRRMHMKVLCSKLSSLIPNHDKSSKYASSQRHQLDRAAIYINELRERIEELKRRKKLLMGNEGITNDTITNSMMPAAGGSRLMPVLEIRDMGSIFEVILISGLNKNFMLYEVITVLQEEGAEVVNVSFSTEGEKVFHTILSQVTSSRVGVETSRLCGRLKELVY